MFDAELFCANLSTLRRNADMTQSELADQLNLTRQAVSRYEKGYSFPDISILVKIAEIFQMSIDDLIGAGAPTEGETELLKSAALGKSCDCQRVKVSDLQNLAPFLKPSTLDRAVEAFAAQGIDISLLVSLFSYMSDEGFWKLLSSASYERADLDLLEKLMPLLNYSSKLCIFDKILQGEIDWHFLSVLMKYVWISDAILESAVIDGILDEGVLEIKRKIREERTQNRIKCPSCGEFSPEGSIFCHFCGAYMRPSELKAQHTET
jgi:transcriptional regulator with XRE-family HTH domain